MGRTAEESQLAPLTREEQGEFLLESMDNHDLTPSDRTAFISGPNFNGTNKPNGKGFFRTEKERAALFSRHLERRSRIKSSLKQGNHTRFPENDATNSCNVNLDDRFALTDTNRGLSTLSSSKPSMGSGPVDSPDLVSRNAKPSHDDISPVPDADATALESTSIPLSQSQKKRRKKKATKARRDAKSQGGHLSLLSSV